MNSPIKNWKLHVLVLALALVGAACDVEDADQLNTAPGLQTPREDAPPDALAAPGDVETQLSFLSERHGLKRRRDAGVVATLDAGATAPSAMDAGTTSPGGATPSAMDAGTASPGGTTPSALDAGTASPATPSATDAGTSAVDAGPAPLPPVNDAGTATPTDAGTTTSPPVVDAGSTPSGLWVTGYYAGWTRATLPPSAIDFRALTHLVDFSLRPRADGTLEDQHGILGNAPATLSVAHAGGAKVLLCIGGAQTAAGFQGATSSAQLSAFVDRIVSTVTQYGYDGVDVDWEPLTSTDRPAYVAFINALSSRLNALTPRRQLTAAVDSWSSTTLALVADKFDQVNLMTYDMATVGSGMSWFNSPLQSGSQLRPDGSPAPSAERSVQSYVGNGLATRKLGIGVAFYGNMYSGGAGTSTGGVTAPRQTWTTAPNMTAIDYRLIITQWYAASRYRFDATAKSAWLSVDELGGANDRYINYDDEQVIAAKFAWAKQRGIGGVIIWQLAGGYLPAATGVKDPLLQAVRVNR